MAHYVDGFVVPVPKKNVEKYRKVAKWLAKSGWSTVLCHTWSAPLTTSKKANTLLSHKV